MLTIAAGGSFMSRILPRACQWRSAAAALCAVALATGQTQAQTFSNTTALNFPSPQAVPALYPSTITVPLGAVPSNTVPRAAVTIRGLSHTFLSDVTIALVSPSGRIIPLLASNNGSGNAANADVTFFAESTNVLPIVTANLTTGIYLPTTNALAAFPAPAPTGTLSPLGSLAGTPTNGVWSLYVFDDTPIVDGGSIAGGWSIEFLPPTTPAPTAFTYQGKIDGATSGVVYLRFSVWDSAAATNPLQRIGNFSLSSSVPVTAGVFTTLVDVGQPLPNDRQLWLQVELDSVGNGIFVTLAPRQVISPAPVASSPWSFGLGAAASNAATTPRRVGVGVLTPAMSLEVAGPNSYYGAPALGLTSGVNWFYTHAPGGTNTPHSFIWNNTSALRFGVEPAKGSGYTELARITPIGDVGLGTQTPTAKLDVRGSINATGDLGLGTDNPTAKLDVRGSISTTGKLLFGNNLDDLIILNGAPGGPNFGIGIALSNLRIHTAALSQNISFGYGSAAAYIQSAQLTGAGNFTINGNGFKPGGGSWAASSDPRLKHDAAPLKGTLDRLLALRGYQFLYNDDVVEGHRGLPGLQIGLMADEVERVFPDWVTRDEQGMRMVTERSTTALMVEALRDLRAEKDAQIAQQRAENAELKARLERLEQLIESQGKK